LRERRAAVGAAIAWLADTVLGGGDDERNLEQQHILEELWREHDYRDARLMDEQLFELIYRAGPDPYEVLPNIVDAAQAVGLSGDALIDAVAEVAKEVRPRWGASIGVAVREPHAVKLPP
jgi:hypothetical protein